MLALLKRDHGIELKSASSTIEEVVARSFVERVARQRNISLPGGDMFAEHPVPAKGGKKATPTEEDGAAEAGGARPRSAPPGQDDSDRRHPYEDTHAADAAGQKKRCHCAGHTHAGGR